MGQVLSRASHFIARFSEMSRASHFTARFSEMQFWSPNILNHATRPQESMKTILGRKSIFTWIVNKFYRTGASQRYGLYFLTLGCWVDQLNQPSSDYWNVLRRVHVTILSTPHCLNALECCMQLDKTIIGIQKYTVSMSRCCLQADH